MKIVIAKFTGPAGVAVLNLRFATLPGISVAWWTAPAGFFPSPPPSQFSAEAYERSIQQLASVNGFTVEIEARGAWEVFTE